MLTVHYNNFTFILDIPTGTNWALGKPVYMSSVHPNTISFDVSPQHAVDGHRHDRRKVAATLIIDSSIPTHWLVLQLLDMIKISTIILIARNPVCCGKLICLLVTSHYFKSIKANSRNESHADLIISVN